RCQSVSPSSLPSPSPPKSTLFPYTTLFRSEECFAGGGKLLIAGNGGSAADSDHIVGELMKGFVKRRPLSEELKQALAKAAAALRSEEHTSELQSRFDLVCRLLLEKKKIKV